MTNNELITELLNYDGWDIEPLNTMILFQKIESAICVKSCSVTKDENMTNSGILRPYLTDMNIMHRIAVKVVNSIRETLDSSDDLDFDLAQCNNKIVTAMFCDPNEQGEHLQLAEAIVNAIRYISANQAV